ncbi:PREDICTED: thionin-like protein 2 [Tarenaya hassleriana]|uniref:thionin-like protein 2 n=1 Tax=Tarenaya hassleriana TaxID=28532 RepID=UPI00053CA645|nr:PREDICTED: thionin-like protein 2 [Tarenaya hassleriana]
MESKTLIMAVLGFVLIMTNTASAGFGDCYSNCVETCAPPGDPAYAKCPFTCLSKCWSDPNAKNPKSIRHISKVPLDPSGICTLRCALNSCADSLNDASKMHVCLQKCSEGVCKS